MSAAGEFAGRLSERIVWQQSADSPDGGGGVTRQWQDAARLWAMVAPLSVSVRTADFGRDQVERFRVVLRYRDGIACGDRLLWRGTVLSIDTIHDPDGRRDRLEAMCTKATNP